MSTTKQRKARFKVGDWVTFVFGPQRVFAQIVESRGILGVKPRPFYRIRLDRDSTEPDSFELPEEELEQAALPTKAAVSRYLKEGGLVAILRSNLGDGVDHPRVWLSYSPSGAVTHTFIAERGVVGGAKVPYFALHERKVFTGKQDEVIAFLLTFGLTRGEAEEIVAAVGTAP
jgi:hypothetical protein